MKKNGIAEGFYKNAGYLVVVLISLVYVASSLINISKTGKSIYEIIASGVLSLIVGIMINGVFRSVGIRKGDEDERTVATNTLHAKTVDEITPVIDNLDKFCENEHKRALREIRTRILASEGMKYSDYFDVDGAAINEGYKRPNIEPHSTQVGRHLLHSTHKEELVEKAKEKAFKKALKVKLTPLVSSNLTSDGVKANDPFNFGKSKKEYTSRMNASDILIKLIMAIIFGYFGVSLAREVNIASIIWNALQIILYVAGGVIQMYTSYMWVVDDYRGSVVKKIDYLQKFKKIYGEGAINNENVGTVAEYDNGRLHECKEEG